MSSNSSLEQFDVGGERFVLSSDRSVNLAYTGRSDFYRTFHSISQQTSIPIDRIRYLFTTYLPSERTGSILFPSDHLNDKTDLLKVLKARIEQLEITKESSPSYLRKDNYNNIIMGIKALIEEIEGNSKAGPSRKKRKPLTENEIFSLILEFSWYLTHPNMEMNDDWESMIKKMDTKSLNALVLDIAKEEEKQGVVSNKPQEKKTALNYFKNIDIKDVIHQSSKNDAMKRIKNMVLFPGSDSSKEIKHRIRELMTILTMKKFLEDPLVYREGLPIIKDTDLQRTTNQMPTRITGGKHMNGLSAPLGTAMMPLFDYFKDVYDPIYSFIEEAMDAFESSKPAIYKPADKFMSELLHLLELVTHLKRGNDGSVPFGIYKINNMPRAMIEFISFMLTYTKEHAMADTLPKEERNEFRENLFKLPVFRVSTFRRGHGSNKPMDGIPFIQFVMLNNNIAVKKDSNFANQPSGLVEKYKKALTFFQENQVYMVISSSNLSNTSQTPLDTFVVDYLESMGPAGYTVSPFEDSTTDVPNLEDVMDISDHGLVHGEIALCAHYQLKKSMPKIE